MGSTSRFVVAAALVLVGGAPSRAEDVASAARVERVRIDAVVTDAAGQPVRGLTRSDFEVLEDGKVQTVTDFVATAAPEPAAPSAAPAGAADEASTEQPPAEDAGSGRRFIVIVIDDLHISRRGAESAKAELRRFLGEMASPSDEIGLVMTGSPINVGLSQDRAALKQAVERIVSRADTVPSGGAQLTAEQAEQILRGDSSALQLGTRVAQDEPGSLVSGGLIPRNASSDPVPAGIEPGDKAAALLTRDQARAVLAEALSVSERTLSTLEGVMRGIGGLPGRKICLLFSDGFIVGRGTSEERTEQLRQVTDAATRSGTSIYAVVATGLGNVGADASVAGTGMGPAGLRERVARTGLQQTSETLEGLVSETGGFLVKGAEAARPALARMLKENESVYLLAYEPLNTRRDGRFRKISVRLPRRAGLVVRSRKGYFAPDARRKKDDRALARRLTPVEARLALAQPLPEEGVPLRVVADYLEAAAAGPQAIVKAQLDASKLPWREFEGSRQAELDVVGGLFDEAGDAASPTFGQHFSLNLKPGEYEQTKENGIRLQQQLPVKAGRYEVRVLALDSTRQPLGGATLPIEVPDLGGKQLTLSSVFLSASSGAEAPLRDAQLLRRFKAAENLYFQLYVYNAAEAEGSDVVIQAQVRSDGKPLIASKPQQAQLQKKKDGGLLPESNGLPLTGLLPGTYELRVIAVDRKANATASRSVDFTVE